MDIVRFRAPCCTFDASCAMNLDALYTKVTEAIERAEALEDVGSMTQARAAFLAVSMLEDELAAALPPIDVEGIIARRGAVRAAMSAGVFAVAKDLADSYASEPGMPLDAATELRELASDAERRLELDALALVRVVPTARVQVHAAE